MKLVSTLLLVCSLVLVSPSATFSRQSGVSTSQKAIAKIKQKVEKIGLNGNVTAKLASGVEIYGAIKNIEDDRFFVAEIDRLNLAEINYGDVSKIQKGYCEPRPFSNKRSCPSTRSSLIAGAAILGGIIAVVIIFIPKT
jgi:hypothetical protein